MKKSIIGSAMVAGIIVLLSAGILMAAPQKICPVMGGEIDKKYYTDYKGYRIYFCCPSCPDDFKKNPEKYMRKLKKEGIDLEKAPSAKAKHNTK